MKNKLSLKYKNVNICNEYLIVFYIKGIENVFNKLWVIYLSNFVLNIQ